jgi:protoporphyrinogen oxidase
MGQRPTGELMRIGIIGGGFAGLTAAYELLKQGHSVDVYEAAPFWGGQAATIEVEGTRIERFYHHFFTSDTDIQQLMAELGISHKLQWRPSQMGFFQDGRIWDFVTPFDLLKFGPLKPWNRIRIGLVTLYLQRIRNWKRFEPVTAQEWLIKATGKEAFEKVWGAQLRAKFGNMADQIGMVWFWGKIYLRFRSRRGLAREVLGYPQGSFQVIIDALVAALQNMGCGLYPSTPVEAVVTRSGTNGLEVAGVRVRGETQTYDAVIATVPNFLFPRLVPDLPESYSALLAKVPYQAALVMLVKLRHPLSHIYWMNIGDLTMPFVGIIEHTNFVPAEYYGNKRLLYISNYLSKESPLLAMEPEALIDHFFPHLQRINPRLQRDWIEEYWVFREASAQPVITTNYSSIMPPMETPIAGLYLANTTQIYPEDRGTNYAVRLGRQIARLLLHKADRRSTVVVAKG